MLRAIVLAAAAAASGGTSSASATPQPEAVAATWPVDPLFNPADEPFNMSVGGSGWSLGNHRVELSVPADAVDARSVSVRVVWRRRSAPGNHTSNLPLLAIYGCILTGCL